MSSEAFQLMTGIMGLIIVPFLLLIMPIILIHKSVKDEEAKKQAAAAQHNTAEETHIQIDLYIKDTKNS